MKSLKHMWCAETCSPSYRAKWSKDNSAYGQCLVTALLVQELIPSDIYKCRVGNYTHFVNVLPNGVIVDATKSQFKKKSIVYSDMALQSREKLLSRHETAHRYELLKTLYFKGE